MEDFKKAIDRFFEDYEKRFHDALTGKDPDVNAARNAFATCFVEASPRGVICNQNDEALAEAIPKGYAFYKSIGTCAMDIAHKDISILDDLHAMVKVHWRSAYQKEDVPRVTIEFDVFYLVQRRDGQLKIFAYVTGDEQKVLQQHGLV